MKPKQFRKIKKTDLPELPEWLKKMQEEVRKSSLGHMSEEEIGQLCEELAERAARKRQASNPSV